MPTRGDEMLRKFTFPFLFTLVSRKSVALSLVTQHAMPPEFGRKWGTVPSAYPAVSGIQREADLFYLILHLLLKKMYECMSNSRTLHSICAIVLLFQR